MKRGSPEILPFCPICGEYKGIRECQNPSCGKVGKAQDVVEHNRSEKCVICSRDATILCSTCHRRYCDEHSTGMTESRLGRIDQHLGTCSICNEIICEQCWILNEEGDIICLKHLMT